MDGVGLVDSDADYKGRVARKGKVVDAVFVVGSDDFERLCVEDVPNMDARARGALSGGDEALEGMDGEAGDFEPMAFIESLSVVDRIIDDGDSRRDIDKVTLAIRVAVIVRKKRLLGEKHLLLELLRQHDALLLHHFHSLALLCSDCHSLGLLGLLLLPVSDDEAFFLLLELVVEMHVEKSAPFVVSKEAVNVV